MVKKKHVNSKRKKCCAWCVENKKKGIDRMMGRPLGKACCCFALQDNAEMEQIA